LFVDQATLTGESLPVRKSDAATRGRASPHRAFESICFLGTSVESGTATAVIVATGVLTYFGTMASSIAASGRTASTKASGNSRG